jgi:hypothetical protein
MANWLLLHYTISSKPSAGRVYIWRKLKRLGALLLQNAVWILPDTPRAAEQFQWLATEIQEMKGDALLWRSSLVLGIQENDLVRQFVEQVDREYTGLMKNLNRRTADLAKLSKQYQQISAEDYFDSELGQQVREKLMALKGGAG